MKVYQYSKLEKLFNGALKVSLMTFVLDLIYIAYQFPIKMGGFVIIFLLFSQIVALVGSFLIGLPVALLLNKIRHKNSITSAILCGVVVYLFVFFYLDDGVYSHNTLERLVFFTTYGILCGHAFSRGYKQELI